MPPWATSLFVPCDRFPEDHSRWDVGLLTRGLRSSPPLDAVAWAADGVADRFPPLASTCAGAEAAGRTRLEPWVRPGSGDLAASLPACSLRSLWQRVLLAVKMPCYLGKLGRKSCFQVSPTSCAIKMPHGQHRDPPPPSTAWIISSPLSWRCTHMDVYILKGQGT